MNFNSFMRKLDGVEDYEAIDSKTTEARPLDMQGINDFARSIGSYLPNLEERQETTTRRINLFWAGYNRHPYSHALGMYGDDTPTTRAFYHLGADYKRSEGDTHSQQQDSVPPTTTGWDAGPDWSPPTCDDEPSYVFDELIGTIRRFEEPVGYTPPSPLTSEEPERSVFFTTDDDGEAW